MTTHELCGALGERPVIAAVRDESALAAALDSRCVAVFFLGGSLLSLPGWVEAAKALEQALNDTGFSPERFAETLPFFHKTLEQTFFKTIKVCIIAMAKRESCRIDSRNQASYEMCRMLAPMLEDTDLPFI